MSSDTFSEQFSATVRVACALCWRSRREQGWLRLVVIPLAFGLFLVGIGAIAFFVPGVLTGPTRAALKTLGTRYFGGADSDARLALAFIVLQSPSLLALAASMTAASIAQNSVGTESARGALEVLASGPVTMRSLFNAVLSSVFVLTLQAWALLAVATLGAAIGGLALFGNGVHLPGSYWAFAIGVPIPLALWAAAISLYLSFAFPAFLEVRAGSVNIGLVVPMLPAVAVLLFATLRQDLPSLGVCLGVMLIALAGTALCVALVGRRFRTDTVLAS